MMNFNIKKIVFVALMVMVSGIIKATTDTLLLQPSAAQGQDWDAVVASGDPNNAAVDYSHPEFMSYIWTCGGSNCVIRSLVNFDLSSIPANATITQATLYLYPDNNCSTNGIQGSPTYGSNNAGWIERVTSSWVPNNVTWNNQPTTTTTNHVAVPTSTSTSETYTLDVTTLYQDIFNSGSNYGIELKQQQETTPYNSLIFGSSNNSNSAIHTKLRVIYSVPTATTDTACIVMQPSAVQGQDWDAAVASGDPNNAAVDYSHPEFMSYIWTCGGSNCVIRSLVNFDLSSIPANATITHAVLHLYADNNCSTNGIQGSPTYGSNNAGWIERVTSSWVPNNVTWNNQPATTSTDRVAVSTSTSTSENYTLDVTTLYQDIFNSGTNYGIELKQQQETTPYNSLIFGSSNNSNSAIHTKLEICYSSSAGVHDLTLNNVIVNVYPVPAKDKLIFKTNITKGMGDYHIAIYNVLGQKVNEVQITSRVTTIHTFEMPRGVYLYRLMNKDAVVTSGKIVLQ